MITHGKEIVIYTGNSNRALAEAIAEKLDKNLAPADITTFSDGEISVNIHESVRGKDVFVVQSMCHPVNDNFMELLIMIDAFKRASAGRVTAVIPYYGYARQDRKVKARDPITAKLVADLITAAGADRVLTMDLHVAQIQGFFDIPVDHLVGVSVLAKHYLNRQFAGDDLVVVSPDTGSVARTRKFAGYLGAPLAIVDKRRLQANVSEVMHIIGDVKDKRCILVDDMIDTGGTICKAASALKNAGAKIVYACCTHPVFSGKAIENIEHSEISEMVVTDTIPLAAEKRIPKIRVLSIADVMAEAIERIYEDLPVSTLYE